MLTRDSPGPVIAAYFEKIRLPRITNPHADNENGIRNLALTVSFKKQHGCNTDLRVEGVYPISPANHEYL